MAEMRISFICTVLNEEKLISELLQSLLDQTLKPEEVIIVDGGSKDNTIGKITSFIKEFKDRNVKFKFLVKKGNRSVGRNKAISHATGDVIVCSDAGCMLDRDWIKNITVLFKNKNIDVVAGYYKGLSKNIFQKCLIPYVLVMENKINSDDFLPATRSMAFRKKVWEKIGGFREDLDVSEDYEFANKIKKNGFNMVFRKDAIVNWIPRKNLIDSFTMFFRFALGDIQANILRPKVIFIFLRYIFASYLILLNFIMKSYPLAIFMVLLFLSYVLWSIYKNYKYVNNHRAFFYLPLLQIISDIAVLSGTIIGIFKLIRLIKILKILRNNKIVTLMIIIYSLTVLSSIKWGIPGNDHPFTYHMDEWHQMQAVRYVFNYGSSNLAGAANGSMSHFFYSGLLLTPFIITHIVNPFSIKSAVDSIPDQEKLFIILRLNTLFFGLLSIITLAKIINYLKINTFVTISLFIFTPAWLMLSNNFKYDIALIFWITLSLFGIIRYSKFPTFNNYLLAGVFSALTLSAKISAIPILPVYIFSFFFFTPRFNKNYNRVLAGVALFVGIFIFFGIPDIVFGGKNMNEYLHSNLFPNSLKNIIFGQNYWSYIITQHLPTIYGHAFIIIFFVSLLFIIIDLLTNLKNRRTYFYRLRFFILLSFFLFFASFIPLKFYIGANKGLVLIPFMVLIVSFSLIVVKEKFSYIIEKFFLFFFVLIIIIQILESYMWVILKHTISPQKDSSLWIEKNVPKNTIIGIENIPIYQFEPDIVLREFYNETHDSKYSTKYKYIVINEKSSKIPPVVIISNAGLELNHYKISSKKLLLKRLIKEGYVASYVSLPKFPFYKFFGSDLNYMHSGLLAYPSSISIFKKK